MVLLHIASTSSLTWILGITDGSNLFNVSQRDIIQDVFSSKCKEFLYITSIVFRISAEVIC